MNILLYKVDSKIVARLKDRGVASYHTSDRETLEFLIKTDVYDSYNAVIVHHSVADRELVDMIRQHATQSCAVIACVHDISCERPRYLFMGYDNCISVQINVPDLVAVVGTYMQQVSSPHTNSIEAGDLSIDLNDSIARVRGRIIPISETPKKALMLLAQHADKVVSKEQYNAAVSAYSQVGGYTSYPGIIRRIRKAIQNISPGSENVIQTVRGKGYMLSSEH